MPELPETEVIAKELRDCCLGASIGRIRIFNPSILSRSSDQQPGWYEKALVSEVQRHGKLILLILIRDHATSYIGIRLGMSGRLIRVTPGSAPANHTHAILYLADQPFEIHYRDPRRFGKIFLVTQVRGMIKGVDPLTLGATGFKDLMRRSKARVKAALMNQSLIAGIGNIYANEILFEAGIHPARKVHRLSEEKLQELWACAGRVLRRGIQFGGTTIRDFHSLYGVRGGFQNSLKVYGRGGAGCLHSGCRGRIRLWRPTPAAQPSFFCPVCQRKP